MRCQLLQRLREEENLTHNRFKVVKTTNNYPELNFRVVIAISAILINSNNLLLELPLYLKEIFTYPHCFFRIFSLRCILMVFTLRSDVIL
jgi:hypothetical protein